MTLFLRLLAHDDKPAALAGTIAAVRAGQRGPDVFAADPESFEQVLGSPFAYWVSEKVRQIFIKLPSFEGEGRTVKQGLATADDFRFVRAWWEVSSGKVMEIEDQGKAPGDFCDESDKGKQWAFFAKGGAYSPYYSDLHLVVNWGRNGKEIREFDRAFIRNENLYFCPGMTWTLRTQLGFNMRAYPAGAIFGHKGPVAFVSKLSLPVYLGLCNSSAFSLLISLQMAFGSYEVGVIQRTPVPDLNNPDGAWLGALALECINLKRDLDRANETSHVFHLPALLQERVPSTNTATNTRMAAGQGIRAFVDNSRTVGPTLASLAAAWSARVAETTAKLAAHQHEIDDIAFKLYGIEGEDRRAIERATTDDRRPTTDDGGEAEAAEEDEAEAEVSADAPGLVAALVSYLAGCAFGRWDVRYATGEKLAPELPDPFAPLPVCSPGMLTGDDDLPLREAPTGYPIHLDPDGILLDDPDHPDDIVRRVREVLDVIFGARAEDIERDACQILAVGELRDYFRRPGNGGFWMDHIRRYSKSRRKAPIYWLLQSPKRNYALWLYYHRLDKDILFKAQVNYVEPKIRLEQDRLAALQDRKKTAGTPREQRQIEREIEKQEALLSDLHDFRDRLARAAKLYLIPDLNDGVVLNIAPLWELVPWKEARQYWDELLGGKYEWSSIGKQLRAKGLVK